LSCAEKDTVTERLCLSCGSIVDDPTGFCPQCGTRIGDAAPKASQQSKKAWIAIAVGLGIAAVLFLVGRGASGGGGAHLDSGTVEREVERGIERQSGERVQVNCDDDVPIEQGRLSDCSVTDSTGTTYYVRVRQDDSQGRFTWQLSP
jgi:hypothetical protein